MRFKIRFQFTCPNWCKVTLVVFMQFFFQSGFSNCLPEQRQSHTLCIYATFFSEWVFKIVFKCLHEQMQSCFGYIVRFSNASLNCLPEEMQSYIDCNCMIFLQSVFSNVPSNHLPELMHSHIGKGTPPEKRIFSFGHCLNYLFPPFPPFRATCTSFLAVKNDVLRVWQKNTNYDNHGCNDNYYGNFDDNDDKKWPNNIHILRVLSKKWPILGTNTW